MQKEPSNRDGDDPRLEAKLDQRAPDTRGRNGGCDVRLPDPVGQENRESPPGGENTGRDKEDDGETSPPAGHRIMP